MSESRREPSNRSLHRVAARLFAIQAAVVVIFSIAWTVLEAALPGWA